MNKTTIGQTAATCFTIQPIHQRTRSLPLTEETVIQLTPINSNASSRSSRDSINSKNNELITDHHQHYHQNNNHQQHIKSSSSMSISSNQNINPNESTASCCYNTNNNNNTCTCSIENHDRHQPIPTVLTTTVENSLENDDGNNSVAHSITLYNNIDTYGGHTDKSTAFKNIFNNKLFMGGGFIQSSYVGGLPLALQRGRSGNNSARSMYFMIFIVLHFII